MKLVVAVIQDYDTDSFLTALSAQGLMATRIASAGGFLRAGNTTVFMGVEDDQIPLVKQLLHKHCRLREDADAIAELAMLDEVDFEHVCASRIGGGVAFIARVTQFERMTQAETASLAQRVSGD